MRKSVKMIVCDLDGTVLRDDKTISARTLDVLRRCAESGILVALATARSETSATQFIADIAPFAVISSGGSTVRVGGEIIAKKLIPRDTADGILVAAMSDDRIDEVTIYGEKSRGTNNPNRADNARNGHYAYSDFAFLPHENAYKMTLYTADGEAAREIVRRYPVCTMVEYSGENMHAIFHREATKRNGLQTLCAHCGIKPHEVVAFGDDYNDREMLEACGTGVAMGNAIDEVKTTADAICDTNENDGVAGWIERNIL